MRKISKFFFIGVVMVMPIVLFSENKENDIRIEVARGSEMVPYLQDVIRLSDEFYSQYPYYYDGTQSDEEFYLKLYGRYSEGWLALAFEGEKSIGYAIGGPMKNISVGVESLSANGYTSDALFLLGEITLLEPYRGRHLGQEMVKQMEEFAKNEAKCTGICLTQLDEDQVLFSKPDGYHSSDNFWLRLGYTPYRNASFLLDWRHIGESETSNHIMYYWIKNL